MQLNEVTPVDLDKVANREKDLFLINLNIFIPIILYYSFSSSTHEYLKYRQLQLHHNHH